MPRVVSPAGRRIPAKLFPMTISVAGTRAAPGLRQARQTGYRWPHLRPTAAGHRKSGYREAVPPRTVALAGGGLVIRPKASLQARQAGLAHSRAASSREQPMSWRR
jgi:hypothetical protein